MFGIQTDNKATAIASALQWFSKTEIDSGIYRSDRLMKAIGNYEKADGKMERDRGSRLFELVSFVAVLR